MLSLSTATLWPSSLLAVLAPTTRGRASCMTGAPSNPYFVRVGGGSVSTQVGCHKEEGHMCSTFFSRVLQVSAIRVNICLKTNKNQVTRMFDLFEKGSVIGLTCSKCSFPTVSSIFRSHVLENHSNQRSHSLTSCHSRQSRDPHLQLHTYGKNQTRSQENATCLR